MHLQRLPATYNAFQYQFSLSIFEISQYLLKIRTGVQCHVFFLTRGVDSTPLMWLTIGLKHYTEEINALTALVNIFQSPPDNPNRDIFRVEVVLRTNTAVKMLTKDGQIKQAMCCIPFSTIRLDAQQ